jgi:hypothetical protein
MPTFMLVPQTERYSLNIDFSNVAYDDIPIALCLDLHVQYLHYIYLTLPTAQMYSCT